MITLSNTKGDKINMSYYIGTIADLSIELKQEAENFILAHKDVVCLATKQEEEVHLTLMGFLPDISLDALYMQTNKKSAKVKNIIAHDTTEIAIMNDTGGIVLTCKTEIVDDENIKKEKWEDWMANYHPLGFTAPDYVLLRYIPQHIKLILIEC